MEPEVEAALVEAAPTQEQLDERRAVAIAKRANAEDIFRTKLRETLIANARDNEVDEDALDLSDVAMNLRLAGLRDLAKAGYSINELEREVMKSGKTRIMAPDAGAEGGRRLIAMESADGRLHMIDSITAEYADLLA